MKLTLTYIDTFQYHGPYRIAITLEQSVADSIQTANDEEALKKALSAYLFGGEFLKHMQQQWEHPALTDEEAGTCCDKDPASLLWSINNWFQRSWSQHSIDVYRATEKRTHDVTTYIVHESVVDGMEDQHLHIAIDHDGEANPGIKAEHLVPTEEEREARRQHEEYLSSLWDD